MPIFSVLCSVSPKSDPLTLPPPQRFPWDNLPILQKVAEAYKLWHNLLTHFPRLSKYTLGSKIDALFTEVLELILLAGYSSKEQKSAFLHRASTKLDALKFFLYIAWELQCLDNEKYIKISESLLEIGKMLGGWRRQFSK